MYKYLLQFSLSCFTSLTVIKFSACLRHCMQVKYCFLGIFLHTRGAFDFDVGMPVIPEKADIFLLFFEEFLPTTCLTVGVTCYCSPVDPVIVPKQ